MKRLLVLVVLLCGVSVCVAGQPEADAALLAATTKFDIASTAYSEAAQERKDAYEANVVERWNESQNYLKTFMLQADYDACAGHIATFQSKIAAGDTSLDAGTTDVSEGNDYLSEGDIAYYQGDFFTAENKFLNGKTEYEIAKPKYDTAKTKFEEANTQSAYAHVLLEKYCR